MKRNKTTSKFDAASRGVYPRGIRVKSPKAPRAGRSKMRSPLAKRGRRPIGYWGTCERRGSVLIVVIGLLLLMMLIGLTFFTFANQEHSAAEYYAESSKVIDDAPNSDTLFDFGIEQLIIGPHDDNMQSVLWPGRHSMIPNMLGMFKRNPGDLPQDPNNPGKYLKVFYPTVPTDHHPFNGGFGVNVISGVYSSGPKVGQVNGAPVVDQNFNGIDDTIETPTPIADGYLLSYLNLSGAAQFTAMGMGAANTSRQNIYNNFPAPDVGYTYPDVNNLFLAHVGYDPSGSNLVVIPSFFRPGLMRDGTGTPYSNWYNDTTGTASDTTTRSLQAHPGHVALYWDYSLSANQSSGKARFLSAAIPQGTVHPITGVALNHTIQYFGFPGNPFTGNAKDINGNPVDGQMGIYSSTSSGTNPATNLDYWVDNDNDGIRDGFWFDLGYPPTTLMDGRIMIPMFSFLVLEGDSLINLNTSGNTSWLTTLSGPIYGYPPGGGASNPNSISHSNLGSSRSEINPYWALIADPTSSTYLSSPNTAANGPNNVFQAYRGVFGRSNLNPAAYVFDRTETANMDMLFMFWGRPNFNVSLNGSGKEVFAVNNLAPGQWGDVGYLLNGLSTASYGTSPPTNLSLFPKPGAPNVDDNGNLLAGLTDAGYLNGNLSGIGDPAVYQLPLPLQSPLAATNPLYPQYATATSPWNSPITVLPFSQPLDFTGAGQWTFGGANGQYPVLIQPSGTSFPVTYLRYNGYQGSYSASIPSPPLAPAYIPYQLAFPSAPALPASQYGQLSINPNTNGVIDEADERISDPTFATFDDKTFAVEETAVLQVDQQDYLAAIGQSRLRQLMSFNLDQNLRAQYIRRRFTTESNDRRHHGFAPAISPNSTSNSSGGSVYYNNPTQNRAWEYSSGNWDGIVPSAASGPYLQFPPMVLSSSKTNTTGMDGLVPVLADSPGPNNPLNTAAAEPFRMELAALIGSKLEDPVTFVNSAGKQFTPAPYQYRSSQAPSTPWQQQLRLNINRILTTADPSKAFGLSLLQSQQNPLRYRELTPHPTTSQWNAIANPASPIGTILSASGAPALSGANAALLFPSTNSGTSFTGNPALQEYWARRDRQQLARDIYVMLYMFGGGQDAVNYATTSNKSNALYETWQLYEMAQFAVNIVDTLDRDNVITVFEFDMDLSDGWNLDDDPMTNDSSNVDRAFVFGVEAQQLAFNEALVAVSRRIPDKVTAGTYIDHPGTLFDDRIKDRTFTYLELFNLSPYAVDIQAQNWQVLLLDPNNPTGNAGPLYPNTSNAISVLTFNDYNNNFVQPGQPYTIASRVYTSGGTNETNPNGSYHASAFAIDMTWDPANNPNTNPNFANQSDANISPYYNIPAPGGTINLDLVSSATTTGTPNESNQPFILTQGNMQGNLSAANTTVGDFCDLTMTTSAPGSHAYGTAADTGVWSTPAVVQFVLRRRINLDRPAPHILTDANYGTDDLDNPYIEVDRISYTATATPAGGTAGTLSQNSGQFYNPVDPTGSTMAAVVADHTAKLPLVNSRERKQPLDGDEGSATWGGTAVHPQTAPPGFYTAAASRNRVMHYYNTTAQPLTPNTIGQTNWSTTNTNGTAAPGTFTLWQPHFDRDFASVMELLSVPLYSPNFVTRTLAQQPSSGSTYNTLVSEFPLPATAGSPYVPFVAQSKILRPQHPTNVGNATPNLMYDNRWYRVLELLEVPPRENLQVENSLLSQYPWLFPQALQRTPGKMNLNGMRYAENLFALLDDPLQFNAITGYNPTTGSYADVYEGARDWWAQLLYARDGIDVTSGMYLPGTPASRPFRSLSHFDSAPGTNKRNSADDTLLRSMPYDNSLGVLDGRSLFEARTRADLASQSAAAGNTVDYHTRQRLLSKIAGNTTPRSNTFLVWMTVGFFEAYEAVPAQTNASGAITTSAVMQIGAEMTDQPRHRGFFVVDRSLLEDAWIPVQFDQNNKQIPGTGIYDFNKFVRYHKTLQ